MIAIAEFLRRGILWYSVVTVLRSSEERKVWQVWMFCREYFFMGMGVVMGVGIGMVMVIVMDMHLLTIPIITAQAEERMNILLTFYEYSVNCATCTELLCRICAILQSFTLSYTGLLLSNNKTFIIELKEN